MDERIGGHVGESAGVRAHLAAVAERSPGAERRVEPQERVLPHARPAALPVLACRLTAVPETAGDAARYVDEERPAAVVDAVEELRDDPRLRVAMVRRGRERSRGWTWDACVDRLARALAAPRAGGGP